MRPKKEVIQWHQSPQLKDLATQYFDHNLNLFLVRWENGRSYKTGVTILVVKLDMCISRSTELESVEIHFTIISLHGFSPEALTKGLL